MSSVVGYVESATQLRSRIIQRRGGGSKMVNEAFAAQYLAVEQELGLDRERTNVNGGAIALGHPLGATGTRLVLILLHELSRRGGRYGLATVGGGQGIAIICERV